MDTAEIRRNFVAHFENDTRWGAHTAVPVRLAAARRPDAAVRQRRHGAVQAVLPRPGDAALPARDQRAEVRAHPRHRGRRQDHPARHVLPDVRQLLLRRLLQGGRDRARLGAGHQARGRGRLRARGEQALPERLRRRRRGASSSGRKVTGLPAERILGWARRRTTGRWASPAPAARARRSSTTAARARPGLRRPRSSARTCRSSEDRLLEIWNLVFMQEELSAVRSKEDFDIVGPLPKQNIDTGMGLERVAFLLQGVDNMYEIDVMFPVIERGRGADRPHLRRRPRGRRPASGWSADHVRSSLMLIGDGVTPGNEGRGYVLRRLMRRAIRSMRLLGCEDPVLPELLPVSRDKMGETYPELHRDWERISTVAYAEEDAFRQTLRAGTTIFDTRGRRGEAGRRHRAVRRAGVRAARHLRLPDRPHPGDGVRAGARRRRGRLPPADAGAARPRQGGRAGQEGRARRRHRPTARSPTRWARRSSSPATPRWSPTAPSRGLVDRGRRGRQRPRGRRGRAGPRPHAVLRRGRRPARRPRASSSSPTAPGCEVHDVQTPITGLIVHQATVLNGEVTPGLEAHSLVDLERRLSISRAHTATHMVHKAFREALGETATQAGLGERAGPVPLRLLRGRRGAGVGDGRRRGAGQRRDPRRPRGARRDHEPGRGGRSPARWRCSARSTATRSAWSRSATGPASCAAAPTPAAPASSA